MIPLSFQYHTIFSYLSLSIQPPLYIHRYTQDLNFPTYTDTHEHKENNTCIYKSTTRHTARTRFRMGLQIPLYQQPERHYERRATPPQPDRTSKVCLPSYPETKANCPYLIQAFVNTKLNVFLRINISIYASIIITHYCRFFRCLLIDYDYSDYRCRFRLWSPISRFFLFEFHRERA